MWNKALAKFDQKNSPGQIITHWHDDGKNLQLVNAGINIVYRFSMDDQAYYLRVSHPSLRDKAAWQAVLNYQAYLYQHQAPVCQPIKNTAGNYILEYQQGDEVFLAHVCKAVPGKPATLNENDLQVYHNWGVALAKFHQISQGYEQDKALFFSVDKLIAELLAYPEVKHDDHIKRAFNELYLWLQDLPKHDMLLCHGDHRDANVIISTDKKATLIDFDEPMWHWAISDLDRPFLEIARQGASGWQQKWQAYLQGYQHIRPLDHNLLQQVPNFMRLKNLGIYLWTKHHWHSDKDWDGHDIQQTLHALKQAI